jgi:hypothetical protein
VLWEAHFGIRKGHYVGLLQYGRMPLSAAANLVVRGMMNVWSLDSIFSSLQYVIKAKRKYKVWLKYGISRVIVC